MGDHLRDLDPKLLMITETIIGDIKERIYDTILTTNDVVSICSSVSAYLADMMYEAMIRISKEEGIKIPDREEFETYFRSDMNRQLIEKMNPSVTVL